MKLIRRENGSISPDGYWPDRRGAEVRLSEVLAGLSFALDLTEGQRQGHAVRSTLIGMRIGELIGLTSEQQSALFYALLMKDLGCSSNAARFAALFAADDHALKANLKTINWSNAIESFNYVATNVAPGSFWLRRVWQALAVLSRGPKGAREVVETRCERGADIARLLAFPEDAVQAIRSLDEHWDGAGQPYGLKQAEIPLLGRIVCLAQTVEVYFSSFDERTAYQMAASRRGTWFDPSLVDALMSLRRDATFWQRLGDGNELDYLSSVEPAESVIFANEAQLDLVAEAFAKVIDAKSPWTYRHSTGVAHTAVAIGTVLGYAPQRIRDLHRAALLHDVGKLAVSNLLLDKPGKLTNDEYALMRKHTAYTNAILSRVGCFHHLADIAASHHERLDGTGYHRGLTGDQLAEDVRILCVADISDALLATRPYREGLPPERVLGIMSREVGTGIDAESYGALEVVLTGALIGPPQGDVPAVRLERALAEDYQQAA
jgi:putative nucleotidyltransferase with HDIG domain